MKILITGGASGLGRAITIELANDKKNFVYFTFNESKRSAEAIVEKFGNTRAIKCDFKNEGDLESLIEHISKYNLDVLVNNAITGLILKHFQKIEPVEFKVDFEQNVMPTIKITQAALAVFRQKKFGKIITILSSYLVGNSPIGLSMYVAQKSYLHSLCKSWAQENAKFNISVNCILPTPMMTNLNRNTDLRILEELKRKNMQNKLTTTDEVAQLVSLIINAPQKFNNIDITI